MAAGDDNFPAMMLKTRSFRSFTWRESGAYDGPSGYSCLAVLPDGSIGCLYERGNKHPYETITFAHFTLDWLTRKGKHHEKSYLEWE